MVLLVPETYDRNAGLNDGAIMKPLEEAFRVKKLVFYIPLPCVLCQS